jgi:hypothetical protein
VKLVRVLAWTPTKGQKINFEAVSAAIMDLHVRFNRPKFLADPYQAESSVQQLKRQGVWIDTVAFTGQALVEMASGLVEIFSSRRIDLYPDAELLSEIRRLRLRESIAGYRLEAVDGAK